MSTDYEPVTGYGRQIQGVELSTLELPFLSRLRTAAERAVILGVQAAIVLLIVGFVLAWMARDYAVTKARAENGQRAFEVIESARKAQAAQQQKP